MAETIKIENWNGHHIRFIDVDGEWQAVLKDVCDALGIKANLTARRLEKGVLKKNPLMTNGGMQEMLLVNELGIYDIIFRSNKPEAKDFRVWVYRMLSDLRKKSGLEGFEVFRMLDKEHQKAVTEKLHNNISAPRKEHYIKANMISNKAIANMYGCPKAIKKEDMTPQMLKDREPILEDAVEVMIFKDKYGVPKSVSEVIYDKYKENRCQE